MTRGIMIAALIMRCFNTCFFPNVDEVWIGASACNRGQEGQGALSLLKAGQICHSRLAAMNN